jgi:AraC-like DNA-binding protein
MQIFDYSRLVDATTGLWGPQTPHTYHQGDGVQFLSEQRRGDLLQETVRLSDRAFLLASDFAPEVQQPHQQIVNGTDWIHIQFRFSGGGFENISDRHVIETPENSCILARYPRDSLIERQMTAAERWKYVCLFASPGGLADLLDIPASRMPENSGWLIDDEDQIFQSHRVALRPSMALAANDVLSCRLTGDSRRTYMRGKALELLANAMDSLKSACEPQRKTVRLTSVDFDRIASARSIMVADLEKTLTLAALARRVGLNRTKLAMGFKEFYGVSVQAFWRDAKLTKARELLRDSDMPVTEVAFSLGYSELSSFTRAFSRKFGILPRDYKRGRT